MVLDIPPDNPVNKERCKVAPPACTVPADALAKELRVALQSRGQSGLRCTLDCDPPAVIDQEASNEIVIVGREEADAAKPFLATEVINELLALHDAGSDCRCSSRQTWDSPIDMRRCCNVKVPALQVAGTQKLPDVGVGRTLGLGEWTCQQSAYGSLLAERDQRFTGCSDLRVFERCDQIGQESGWPEHIVIGKNRDRGPHVSEAFDHLKPLVRFLGAQDLHSGRDVKAFAYFSDVRDTSIGRHDDDAAG